MFAPEFGIELTDHLTSDTRQFLFNAVGYSVASDRIAIVQLSKVAFVPAHET